MGDKKIRILLVDDEEAIIEVYRRMLGRDYDLRTASSGLDALRIVHAEEPFAVVLSDFSMPGTNGVEFLRIMRELSPNTSRILLSGLSDTPGVADDPELAVCLLKPCPLARVIAVLKEAIDANRKRLERGASHES